MDLKIRFQVLLAVCIAACGPGYETSGQGPATTTATSNPAPATTCGIDAWSTYAAGVFTAKCVGCHSNQATYNGVKADLSAIQLDIDNGLMPPNAALDANDKSRLVAWIACGAPLNPTVSGSTSAATTGGASSTGSTGGTLTTTGGPTTTAGNASTTTGGSTTTTTGGSGTTGTTTGTAVCTPDTYSNYVQGLFAQKCTSCHGGLSSYAGVSSDVRNVESQLNANAMPPGTPLDAADNQRVLKWIACGLPQ